MRVIWHKRAVAALQQIEGYVLENFGEKARKEFVADVEQVVELLSSTPEMGRIDPLFAHRKQTYRSIIIRRLNKLVYYVKDDTIRIVAFWDTRREPKVQAGRVR